MSLYILVTTSFDCTPSGSVARTEMVGSRSRRHSMPCCITGTTLATCDSGTDPPKSVGM